MSRRMAGTSSCVAITLFVRSKFDAVFIKAFEHLNFKMINNENCKKALI